MRYVQDDGGRAASLRPRQKNDCVVRACAIAMNRPYDHVYDALAAAGRKCGRGTAKQVWQPWLTARAQRRRAFPAVKGEPRMNLERFAAEYTDGRYVVQMAKHTVAVVDGIVVDDWRPDGDRCVYAVWRVA